MCNLFNFNKKNNKNKNNEKSYIMGETDDTELNYIDMDFMDDDFW